jgi:hypothetical protein
LCCRRAASLLVLMAVLLLALGLVLGGLLLARTPSVVPLAAAPAPSAPSPPSALSPAHAHQAALWLRAVASQAALGPPTAAEPPPQPLPAEAAQALAQDITTRVFRHEAAARVQLAENRATVALSVPLQALPHVGAWLPAAGQGAWPAWLPRWLNIKASLWQAPGERLPQLQALHVGRVAVPLGPRAQAGTRWVLHQWVQRLGWQTRANQLALALAAVQQVTLQPQGIQVQLLPPLMLGQQLGALLLPGVPLQRLQPYCQQLVQVLQPVLAPRQAAPRAAAAADAPVPLFQLLQPMMALSVLRARQAAQAVPAGPTPGLASHPLPNPPGLLAQELQLATFTVALYATRVPPLVLSMGLQCPLPAHRALELAGRHDHALHFLLSALLVQGANPMLADAIGLYKELADVGDPQGSGFSFDDLAADQAGAAFGQLSRQAPERLVQRAALMRSDAFLMPSVQGLPSQLSAEQLKTQLGGYGSARFNAWMAEVERRVKGLPVLGP